MTPPQTLARFQALTGFDVAAFMTDYANWATTELPSIFAFYGGQTTVVPSQAFSDLDSLTSQGETLDQLITQHAYQLNSISQHELVITISDINTRLQTAANLSKYLRTTVQRNVWNASPTQSTNLAQYQTLENLAAVNSIPNPQDYGYIGLAFQNNLLETDYDYDTYNELEVYKGGNIALFMQSVVDNLAGENLYGLDLNQKLTFNNSDLEVLDYEDTFFQSVQILTTLKQGDHPFFPLLGRDPLLGPGANQNTLKIPLILQQLANTFASDDSIKSWKLSNPGIAIKNSDVSFTFDVLSNYLANYQPQLTL